MPDGARRTPSRRPAAAVSAESAVKPWELPKWTQARARELGLDLAARPGPQRSCASSASASSGILRELEKLALALPSGGAVTQEDVEELGAHSAERKAWTLADALVARDGATAAHVYLELRTQGERLPGLLGMIVRRLREGAGRRGAGSTRARRRRRSGAGCACRPRRPSGSSPTSRAPTSSRCSARSTLLADLELDDPRRRPRASSPRTRGRSSSSPSSRDDAGGSRRRLGSGRRVRAARDFLRAPVFLCSAPRLTALSIVETSARCSVSAVASSPAATAASRRRKYVLIASCSGGSRAARARCAGSASSVSGCWP